MSTSGNPLVGPDSSFAKKYESNIFKLCFKKCTAGVPINLKGEAIHHIIYECMGHCGEKYADSLEWFTKNYNSNDYSGSYQSVPN